MEGIVTVLQLSVCPPTRTECIIFTFSQGCSESQTSAEVDQAGFKESGYMQIASSRKQLLELIEHHRLRMYNSVRVSKGGIFLSYKIGQQFPKALIFFGVNLNSSIC